MAEATTEISVTPKQLGKHLRSIRRKKGLSLSEVARGAGLSRRELVNYERGKVAIPESDLWVLAGSCGVDVAELMPSASSNELTAAANSTSVGDTVSQLRRGQEDAGITAYLHTLQKLQALPAGKRIPVKERELEEIATALGSTPRAIELKLQEVLQVSPDEAERLRAMILVPPNGRGKPRALAAAPSVLAAAAALEAVPAPPVETPPTAPIAAVPTPAPLAAHVAAPLPQAEPVEPPELVQPFPVAPAAFLDQPLDAPLDAVQGHNVDVFEELARLPEPVPLGDPSAPLPDVLAPQDPFVAPFAGVPALGPPEGAVELVDTTMPAPGRAGAAAWSAAEAPPIDVAMRQGSSTWDLGEPPLVAKTTPAPDAATWETDGWQPPAHEGTDGTTGGFWEGTDEWTPPQGATADDVVNDAVVADVADVAEVVEESSAGSLDLGEDTWAGTTWDPDPWTPPDTAAADTAAADTAAADTAVEVNPWSLEEWPQEPADRGAWDHRPDPAAVDTGFYVDWGTPETETPPGWNVFADTAATAAAAAPPLDVDAPAVVESGDTFALFDDGATPGADDTTPVEEPPAWDPWSEPTDTFDATAQVIDDVEAVEAIETFDTTTIDTTPFDRTAFEPVEAFDDVEAVEAIETFDTTTFETTTFDTTAFDTTTFDTTAFDTTTFDTTTSETGAVETFDTTEAEAEPAVEPAVEYVVEPIADLAPISWRADGSQAAELEATCAPAPAELEAVEIQAVEIQAVEFAEAAESAEPEPEPEPVIEEFVTAGPDWQLGNALPLVEVRGQGGLVMRRADERWALADVPTGPDFVAEVAVDFRSGPGLGVLFRASVDDDGRMSGYSFDIDPIYDGGGYLVRQWQADRELWNPIARVSGDDPASMYGTLLVRLELVGEHLSAHVNGVEVLTVENLKQASADRGRDAATGHRVGVQAWSSSDLVIDSVRVASR